MLYDKAKNPIVTQQESIIIINHQVTVIYTVYTCTCLHDLDNLSELVHVFPTGQEPLQHEDPEILVHVALQTSHHLTTIPTQYDILPQTSGTL